MATQLTFKNTNHSRFFVTARRRVEAYFTQRGLSPHANKAMWAKALFFLVGYATLYGLLLSNQLVVWPGSTW